MQGKPNSSFAPANDRQALDICVGWVLALFHPVELFCSPGTLKTWTKTSLTRTHKSSQRVNISKDMLDWQRHWTLLIQLSPCPAWSGRGVFWLLFASNNPESYYNEYTQKIKPQRAGSRDFSEGMSDKYWE
jgi:hypothetical protein